MAKRKSNLGKPLAFVAAVLGLVAVVMLFLPAIGIKDTDTTYTGLQITFGCKVPFLSHEYTIFNFSFMNLLTYILAVVGIVFSVLSAVGKGSKFASFIAAAAFAVSGVFFFLSVSYTLPNENASRIISLIIAFVGDVKDVLTLAYGAIIGGVASLLAAVCNLGKIVLK